METIETRTDGITVGVRKRDNRVELCFGIECFVLDPATAKAINEGIQECLTHIETLKKEPVNP